MNNYTGLVGEASLLPCHEGDEAIWRGTFVVQGKFPFPKYNVYSSILDHQSHCLLNMKKKCTCVIYIIGESRLKCPTSSCICNFLVYATSEALTLGIDVGDFDICYNIFVIFQETCETGNIRCNSQIFDWFFI